MLCNSAVFQHFALAFVMVSCFINQIVKLKNYKYGIRNYDRRNDGADERKP